VGPGTYPALCYRAVPYNFKVSPEFLDNFCTLVHKLNYPMLYPTIKNCLRKPCLFRQDFLKQLDQNVNTSLPDYTRQKPEKLIPTYLTTHDKNQKS